MIRALCVVGLVAAVGCAPSMLDRAQRIPALQSSWTASEGDELGPAFDALRAMLDRWGFRLESLPPDAPMYGRVSVNDRVIQMQLGFSPNASFEILAHEVGHIFQPRTLDHAQGELFAEWVSVGLAKHYGYTATATHSAQYAAGFKAAIPAVRVLKADVDLAIRAATGQIAVRFPR